MGRPSTVAATRPTLLVQTAFFHESEHRYARVLGESLYNTLTRPITDPLALGAGVPVRVAVPAGELLPDAASHMVVVCLLSNRSAEERQRRDDVITTMNEWQNKLSSGLVIALALSDSWLTFRSEFADRISFHLVEMADDINANDYVTRAVAEVMSGVNGSQPALYVSCAKDDLPSTGHVVDEICAFARKTGGFFSECVRSYDPVKIGSIPRPTENAVLLAIRSDSYSNDRDCQRALYVAKRRRLPILNLIMLAAGEQRSLSYGGNTPSLPWNEDPRETVLRALIEWIRAHLFMEEAARIQALASLPESRVMVRPPEAFDLSIRGGSERAELVIYPDPELPVAERHALANIHNRLHLMTPTAIYRYLKPERHERRERVQAAGAPLESRQVGLSLSRVTEHAGTNGLIEAHLDDAVIYVARSLIAAGAEIAFGGDFRAGGFEEALSRVISRYNLNARRKPKLLHHYVAVPDNDKDTSKICATNMYRVAEMERATDGKLGYMISPASDAPTPLYYSDMRRLMAGCLFASIVIGGQTTPAGYEILGYSGRYPGVVEESWRMLAAGKPLYVAGGFGGAAGLVAHLLQEQEVPSELVDKNWLEDPVFAALAKKIDAHEARERLGLPHTMESLGQQIILLSDQFLVTDEAALAWNGLTRSENRKLLHTTDPVELAGLVLKGITYISRLQPSDARLSVELVHGDVTSASDVDALSVPVSEGVPIGAAAHAVNQAVDGRLPATYDPARTLVCTANKALTVDWIHLANLQLPSKDGDQPFDVGPAADDAVSVSQRYGFRRLGIVLYGDDALEHTAEALQTMFDSLQHLAGQTELVWYEPNLERFESIEKYVREHLRDRAWLTTREGPLNVTEEVRKTRHALLMVMLSEDEHELRSTFVPPGGTGIASVLPSRITPDGVDELAGGISIGGGLPSSVPGEAELEERGHKLARCLFGSDADRILAELGDAPLQITHNLTASKIPFELLRTASGKIPVLQNGVSRRLAVNHARVIDLFASTPRIGKMKGLVVIDPTDDLPGAREEGEAVVRLLKPVAELTVLRGNEATKSAVLEGFESVDFLHYSGHSFFVGKGLYESGLTLAGPDWVSLEDIRSLDGVPRLVFFNACQAARVRGKTSEEPLSDEMVTESATFAEFFLRRGVEAYLGTHWYVNDRGAQIFGVEFYKQLVQGETVADSVLNARQILAEMARMDWANYVLYGEGSFRFR